MYTIPPKKMLILNILDILKKYSDVEHRLSQKDIVDILERDYFMKVDRKAVKRNLLNLIDFGYELEYSEAVRKNKNDQEETICSDWYMNRDFTDPELRLLIDSLLFSKHIPYNQCKEIIAKLEGLSSTYFQARVRHIRNMPEHLPENKDLFYTIDILDEAIQENKMVAFQYIEFGMDKKPHARRNKDGKIDEYAVSPYQMAATNGRYYLICNRKGFPRVSYYRLDRITKIKLLDEPRTPLSDFPAFKHGLDLPKLMAEHVYMFAGESVRARFRAKQYILSDILDWFGKDVSFLDADETDVTAVIQVNENAMFYWAMQYGEHIEVLEPLSLRERVAGAAAKISAKY